MGVQPDKMHIKREVRPRVYHKSIHKFSICGSRISTSFGQNVAELRLVPQL